MKYITQISLLILLFSVNLAFAQTQFLYQSEYQNRISISTGFQPGFNTALSYERLSTLPFSEIRTSYAIKVKSPLYRSPSENISYQASVKSLLLENGSFQLMAGTAITRGRLSTKLYQAKKWEWNNELEMGYFGKKARVSVLASYNQNIALRMEHSDFYRDYIYSEARDGLYKGVGSYFDAGLSAGYLIKNRVDVGMEIKSAFTQSGKPLTVLPMQVILELSWRI